LLKICFFIQAIEYVKEEVKATFLKDLLLKLSSQKSLLLVRLLLLLGYLLILNDIRVTLSATVASL
jgi:hypothetical protein